jgi:hypothetical protein
MKSQKIGVVFKNMLVSCPAEISTYATCITRASDGGVDKDVCAREFQALKKCFGRARVVKR